VILICYDGSDDARAAVADAGRVLAGHPAIVLTVWEPIAEVLARTAAGTAVMAGLSTPIAADDEAETEARRVAEEGTEIARTAGFDASPRVCPQTMTVADTIIAQADRANATAIVMGTRGRTGLQSVMGSVSHAVVQKSDRAVMVVPSGHVVADRRKRLHHGRAQPAD
jgi:nucleotide-binding universal stress UspA family protein